MSITPAEEAQIVAKAGGMPMASTAAGIPTIAYQTFDRRFCSSAAFAPTTTLMTGTSIVLPAGTIVSAITFMSGAQAESGGSHLWYALYRGDTGVLLAQSADTVGAAAFGASLSLRLALTAAQTVPYTGLYYICFCATATTMPTLLNVTASVITGNGAVASTAPTLSFTADTGLGASAPATMGARTAITQSLWAGVD